MFQKLLRSIRKRVAPTGRDRAIKRWRSDRGDETLRYDYPLDSHSLVFDLGGYQGEWAARIFDRYNCQLEVFEPAEPFARKLEQRFSQNTAVHVHRCGLGAKTRTERLALCSDASSTFRTSDKTIPIEIVDVADWWREHNVGEIDLMKVNIEGGEYELLERMLDQGLVTGVKDFQVQFHDLTAGSAARMEAILKRLSATHKPTYKYKFVWENWRRL